MKALPSIPSTFFKSPKSTCLFLFKAVLFAITWLAILDFPKYIASENPDLSFMQAYGFFFKNHLQAGVDYIFTGGPLFFFFHDAYDSDLFWPKILWEMSFKFLFVITVFRLPNLASKPLVSLAACATILLFSVQIRKNPDPFYTFVILAQLLLILDSASAVSSCLRVALIAILSLTKFTLLLFTSAGLLIILCYLTLSRRFFLSLALVSTFAVVFIGIWCSLGQHLATLPHYLVSSFHVSREYSEAMGLFGKTSEVYSGITLLAVVAIATIPAPIRMMFTIKHAAQSAILALCCLILWKHGISRQDHNHISRFFSFFVFLPFLIPAFFRHADWQKPVRLGLVSLAVFISVCSLLHFRKRADNPVLCVWDGGAQIMENLQFTKDPSKLKDQLEDRQVLLQDKHALPRIKAHVKDATVDIFSYEQGVLLLNQFRWHPRPVFQSYCAYDPFLISQNAKFFRKPTAPEFVIFKLQPIDGRHPFLEDGLTILEILRNYRPILIEKEYLLFQKLPAASVNDHLASQAILQGVVTMNQEVKIAEFSDQPLRVSFNITNSTWGKLCKAFYKPWPLHIALRTNAGNELIYRLNPKMAQTGFLINPLLIQNWDFVSYFASFAPTSYQKIDSFRIVAGPEALKCFQPEVEMKLEKLADLPGSKVKSYEIACRSYPLFEHPPLDVQAGYIGPSFVHGQPVLVVHPDGQMTFDIPSNVQEIRAQFGILPEAYEQHETDGVFFSIELNSIEGNSVTVFERHLDPKNNPQDRGIMSTAIKIPIGFVGHANFRTFNRPGDNDQWDWSFWSKIEFN
jgi:hypothetical protein